MKFTSFVPLLYETKIKERLKHIKKMKNKNGIDAVFDQLLYESFY
jgi:hypothetical protein